MEDEQLECALALDSLPSESSNEKKLELIALVLRTVRVMRSLLVQKKRVWF